MLDIRFHTLEGNLNVIKSAGTCFDEAFGRFVDNEDLYNDTTQEVATLMDKEDLNKITRKEVHLLRNVVKGQEELLDKQGEMIRTMEKNTQKLELRVSHAMDLLHLLANPILKGE
jgi:hypothetical protein